ncbi:MAG: FMN-binding protein [Oscillospiraceae bacterium]|nr:FMN-binding protein [Oscillospiraceae bacterium]
MLFLIAIIVAGLFSWFCADALRKHPIPFYITGTLLSIVMILLNQMHVQFTPVFSTYVIGLFNRGALAAALWCVVAWVGALPDELKEIRKKLLPARGELSIFSALITLSHAVVYGISYVKRLFSGRSPETDFILTCVICLALMLIMIPLTVISFKAIRKKMNGKTWKNVQRAAYVFYALIYLHIMVILVPRAQQGREGVLLSVLVYTIVFAGYAVCRIRKAFIKKKRPESKTALNGICTAVLLLITSAMGISSRAANVPTETTERTIPTESVSSAETSAPVSETASTPETETVVESEKITETENESVSVSETISETETLSETSTETSTPDISVSESTAETQKVSETQTSSAETSVQETTAVQEEAPQEQQNEEEQQNIQDEPAEENPVQEENQTPEPEPEPVNTIYNDGVYTAEEFGYDSTVYITVTIENDVITDISATCEESDMYYFEVAYPIIRNAMLSSQSADVDAVSGSTYSSDALRNGVRKALDSARK